jgi:hypothetical protein
MWAYDVKNYFAPTSSKKFNFIIPDSGVRVGARVLTVYYISKGRGYGIKY